MEIGKGNWVWAGRPGEGSREGLVTRMDALKAALVDFQVEEWEIMVKIATAFIAKGKEALEEKEKE